MIYVRPDIAIELVVEPVQIELKRVNLKYMVVRDRQGILASSNLPELGEAQRHENARQHRVRCAV